MKHLRCRIMLAGLLIVLIGPVSAFADGQQPIAMSEVGKMVEADQSPQQILQVMVDRGISFRVTGTSARRLERWGFTEDQIGLVRKIAAGEKVELDAKPDAPDAPGQVDDAPEFGIGYPNAEHFHIAEQRRIERAIENAGLGYQRIELSRCTLYCSNRRARALVPMLRQLEADLIKRFPESIVNATSPKSAHIVIVDGISEWRKWVNACFDSYEQDRIKFNFGRDDDPRPKMIQGSGYMLPACAVTHADKQQSDEAVARYAAFSVGHLMMTQAGGEKQSDGLKNGFGDLAETMAFRTPSVMLYSYEERDLGQAEDWRAVVAQRFKDASITDPAKPWSYSNDSMQPAHYAECWSLVSTLAQAPEKFAQAVGMVREGTKPMGPAVLEVYEIDSRKLLEAWHRFVTQ